MRIFCIFTLFLGAKHFYYWKIWLKFTLKLRSPRFNKQEKENLHFLRIRHLGTDDRDDLKPCEERRRKGSTFIIDF